jgi:hypothetical protein
MWAAKEGYPTNGGQYATATTQAILEAVDHLLSWDDNISLEPRSIDELKLSSSPLRRRNRFPFYLC